MPVIPGQSPVKRAPIPEAMLTVSLELLAVALFTLMAGGSKDIGTIMVILMVGFWMVYLVTNANVISRLEILLENA